MLRFIKGNLTSIEGIEIYPVISLTIFMIFFIGLFWWVARADKNYLKQMEHFPLEEDK